MIVTPKLLLSVLILTAALPFSALAAEPLTEDQLDSVSAGCGRNNTSVLPVTFIMGSLSSTKGLTANFITSGYISVFSDGKLAIATVPVGITGVLSSTNGLSATLTTKSGYVFLITGTNGAVTDRLAAQLRHLTGSAAAGPMGHLTGSAAAGPMGRQVDTSKNPVVRGVQDHVQSGGVGGRRSPAWAGRVSWPGAGKLTRGSSLSGAMVSRVM